MKTMWVESLGDCFQDDYSVFLTIGTFDGKKFIIEIEYEIINLERNFGCPNKLINSLVVKHQIQLIIEDIYPFFMGKTSFVNKEFNEKQKILVSLFGIEISNYFELEYIDYKNYIAFDCAK